ncbi:MAG TPA: methyltransferase domain-containing protein, partial [Pseudobdellovibrionaceae bacterium]|nr:methyltransferase domain-containing protein [Pseudobdellovibrionaceae bacterium]
MNEPNAFQELSSSSYEKMPGHWLLASMGKRVLRPGGLELSRWLIETLDIGAQDDVVELAPGLGRTAELILERHPRSYVGVEKNEAAADLVRKVVSGPGRSIRIGDAGATGLPDACATVACGEAFLTMQGPQVKARILKEIARILKPGGIYGMHELSLSSDSPELVSKVQQELSENIRVNARPLSVPEWSEILEEAGFEVLKIKQLPMALLEPGRLWRDEGAG